MTPKELGELGRLERACPRVNVADLPEAGADALLEPGMRKSVTHLREFAAIPESYRADKSIEIDFDFFASPVEIQGDGKVERIVIEETELDTDMRSRATGRRVRRSPATWSSAVSATARRRLKACLMNTAADGSPTMTAVSFPVCIVSAGRGVVPPARSAPTVPTAYAIADLVAEDIGDGAGKQGREGLDALLKERGTDVVTFRDWKNIEKAETGRARDGSPREKFTAIEDMIRARG